MQWWEWVIILGFAIFVDILNIILNLAFQSGVIINRFISFGFGLLLAGYLSWRGVSMVSSKRLFGLVTTFIIEEIPDVDSIPTWTIDVIWTWWTTKSKIIAKTTGKVDKTMNRIQPFNQSGVRSPAGTLPPLNQGGSRAPGGGLVRK